MPQPSAKPLAAHSPCLAVTVNDDIGVCVFVWCWRAEQRGSAANLDQNIGLRLFLLFCVIIGNGSAVA
jgi:hypothetical protein